MPQECRSCHAPVYWAEHHANPAAKPLPFDWGSADGDAGVHAVWRDGQGVPRYRALKKGEQPAEGEHRMVCHWGTCPDRARWRGRAQDGTAPVTRKQGCHEDAQA